jgi:hypothetical protein
VVEQSARDLEFKGSNVATVGTETRIQGTLTEGVGSVPLTSSLRRLFRIKKDKCSFSS